MIRRAVRAALALALILGSARPVDARLPRIAGPVTDPGGLLAPAARAELTRRLVELEERTALQAAILVTEESAGLPLEDYSLAVAEQWEGGVAGSDRGLLILLVTRRRAVRLELGYGLEEVLPDAVARQLLEGASPHLQSARWAEALELVLDGIESRTRDLRPDTVVPRRSAPLGGRLPWTYLAVLGGGALVGLGCRRFDRLTLRLLVPALGTLAIVALFREGPSWWWVYGLTWLVGALAPVSLGTLARRRPATTPWMGLGLAAGALLSLGPVALAPAHAAASDVALLLALNVGLALLAPALPWLAHRPWLLAELLRALVVAGGATYGRQGRLPPSRDWRGGGGGFGGGGADKRW